MRVVTQNLWGWYFPLDGAGIGRARPGGDRPGPWSDRRAVLADGLRVLDPDLVAFQAAIHHDDYDHTSGDEPGHTFTPENPMVADGAWPLERGRRIDDVLVRCRDHGPGLDIAACARIFDQPVGGIWANDHFGVVADLVPAPPEPLVPF